MRADDSASKGKSDTRSITGCLSQGDNAKEFKLTADDGSTWEVRSSRVVKNAKAHNMKEDAKDMAHDTGAMKHNEEHGHMTVTDLQMVSDSCSR
jgi:hypothetical protein